MPAKEKTPVPPKKYGKLSKDEVKSWQSTYRFGRKKTLTKKQAIQAANIGLELDFEPIRRLMVIHKLSKKDAELVHSVVSDPNFDANLS